MLPKLHLDFETYSEISIKTVGAFRYAEDPSTEILILGWSIDGEEPVAVDMSQPDAFDRLDQFFSLISKGAPIGAHNAHFERAIWEKVGRFPVTPKACQWDCTAARARALAIPGSLEGAANALGLGLQKDPRGDALITLFSKPHKKKGRCFPADRPDDFQEFMRYCQQDVRVEAALDKILPALAPIEKEAFTLDYKINDAGIPVNMDRVNAADAFVDQYSNELVCAAEAIAGCRPTQREKTLAYLEGRGFLLPNLQAATVEEFAQTPNLPDDLKSLMDFRIELSRAGTKKLKTIKECISSDNRLRGSFLFSAASTRRWSSTGVQVHNLQKPEGEANPQVALSLLDDDPNDLRTFFDRPLTVLAQSIRGFFETDQSFLVADYASIEPRGLAWAAGEQWLLEAYHKDQDAYKIAAGRVYGISPSQVDASQRFMGKQVVLGAGYGMGPDKFIATCMKFGRTPSPREAEEAIYGYRNSVPSIVKFWRKLEVSCIKAIRGWKEVQYGRFTFRPATLPNGFQILYVDMPSGTIAYPKPFLGEEEWNGELRSTFNFWTPLGSSWVPTDTFGGSLAENVVQALCRDLLRDGMLAADKAGFKMIGHFHDEAMGEGNDSPSDLAEFEHQLCSSSPWAEGFPIKTEGYISPTYRK